MEMEEFSEHRMLGRPVDWSIAVEGLNMSADDEPPVDTTWSIVKCRCGVDVYMAAFDQAVLAGDDKAVLVCPRCFSRGGRN